jgi:hypothetical protein
MYYIMKYKPYDLFLDNYLEAYNEFIIFLNLILVLGLLVDAGVLNHALKENIGAFLIS